MLILLLFIASTHATSSVAGSGLSGGTCVWNEDCLQSACDTCIDGICAKNSTGARYSLSTAPTSSISLLIGLSCLPSPVSSVATTNSTEAEELCTEVLKADAGCIITEPETIFMETWNCLFVGVGSTGGNITCPGTQICSKELKCVDCINNTACFCSPDNVCIYPSAPPSSSSAEEVTDETGTIVGFVIFGFFVVFAIAVIVTSRYKP